MSQMSQLVNRIRLPRAFRPPAQINAEEGTNGHPETNRGKTAPKEAEDGKKDERSKDGSEMEPVGFWHPDLRQVRNRAFVKWTITTSFLMAFILAILSLYWGVFFKVEDRLTHLLVYVVDMDGVAPYDNTGTAPFVGPTITQLVEQQISSGQPTLGWGIRPASDFNNDPLAVRQAVYNFDAWAAIIINPNASALLHSAVATGNASYDPLGACQLVYQDSRDDTNWFDFMLPIISQFMTQAQSQVGQKWAQMVLQNASSNPDILSSMQNVPQALNPSIGFSEYNLRPFFPYTAIPAVSIGLICTYLFPLALCITQYLSHSLGHQTNKHTNRPHHHLLLLLLLLHAYPHAIRHAGKPPASQIPPAHRLALVRHYLGLLHALASLFFRLPRLPNQLLPHKPNHQRNTAYSAECG